MKSGNDFQNSFEFFSGRLCSYWKWLVYTFYQKKNWVALVEGPKEYWRQNSEMQTRRHTVFKAVIWWGRNHAPESTCEQIGNRQFMAEEGHQRQWCERTWRGREMEGLVKYKSGWGRSDRTMERKKRLAPQPCVVPVQARTEWSTCYK